MTYNFLGQLLDNGISEEELISSLSKSLPHLAKKARKMMMGGWSYKDIINTFSRDKQAQKVARQGLKPTTPAEIASMHLQNSYNNIPQSTGQQSKEQLTNFTKKVAPYAIPAMAAPFAAPMAEAALSHALPKASSFLKEAAKLTGNALPLPTQEKSQNPLLNSEQKQPLTTSQPPVNVPSNIPQPAQPAQPKGITNPKEYLEKHGILDRVKDLLARGNTPEAVAATLGMKRTGEAKIDPELLSNIEEYAKQPKEEFQAETPKIEKSSIVASPHGVGEVKEIRNGKALIDIDGKKHQVNEDDLIQSPIPQKELADLYDDVISGIERETGQQVSRNVEWAGYDPNVNELAYKPHGSDKLYVYEDISPEDSQQLTSLLTQRKSSGSNFIGAWEKGTTSPIGAAMYQLIQKLQAERGGKGNEYRNKYETIYDALEPAKSAARKRHAERKKKAKKSGLD